MYPSVKANANFTCCKVPDDIFAFCDIWLAAVCPAVARVAPAESVFDPHAESATKAKPKIAGERATVQRAAGTLRGTIGARSETT